MYLFLPFSRKRRKNQDLKFVECPFICLVYLKYEEFCFRLNEFYRQLCISDYFVELIFDLGMLTAFLKIVSMLYSLLCYAIYCGYYIILFTNSLSTLCFIEYLPGFCI